MAPIPKPEGETDKGPTSEDDFNEVDNITPPQFIINDADSNDSDSSGEEIVEDSYHGYQMLPQDDEENEEMEVGAEPSNDDHEHSGNETIPVDTNSAHGGGSVPESVERSSSLLDHSVLHQHTPENSERLPQYMQVPNLPKSNPNELLWNKQRPNYSAEMETDHADKVKAAMSNIKLAQVNIPDWAKGISDDQWKEKLLKIKSDKDPS